MPRVQVIWSRNNSEMGHQIIQYLKQSKINIDDENICIINQFANTEINVKLEKSVRDNDVYIISSGCATESMSINDSLVELLMLISACSRSNASKITAVLPCFPYARADKKDHRGTIGAKVVINMLQVAGATRIICMDLHAGQIQGMSDIPLDNLYGIGDICGHLSHDIFEKYGKQNCLLVSPDAGSIKRTKAYANLLKINYVILEKQRNYEINNTVEKSVLIGDASLIPNKYCIMIDDMIDTAGTMLKGAAELMSYNAKGVILVATHGILSYPAIDRINGAEFISDVVVTNTIPQTVHKSKCPKLSVVDVSYTLATVIERLSKADGESISELFEEKYIKEYHLESKLHNN